MFNLTEHYYPDSSSTYPDSSTAPYSLILDPNSWRKRNPLMQNNSEHIHDCDDPVHCPGVCIQNNFGMVNLNSHNSHRSQLDNCGNVNQR